VIERFGYEDVQGVLVTDVKVGSEAFRKGIREGVVITEVNRKTVKNTRDFQRVLEQTKDREHLLLRITNGRDYRIIGLKRRAE